MNILKGFDLIDYAIVEDVDFVALVVSPWHMLGVQAVIGKLKEKYDNLHGLIAVCKNGNGNYTINSSLYRNMQGVEFVYYDSEIKKDFRIWKAMDLRIKGQNFQDSQKFFLIPYKVDAFVYAYYANRQKRKNVECYILDEGLGAYCGLGGNDADNKRRYRTFFKKKIMDCLTTRYTNKLVKYERLNDFSILKLNDKKKWVNNEKSIGYYRKALNKKTVLGTEANQIYSNAVVINTQPFMGVGVPENDVDIDILLSLCKVCKEKDIKVVIKPHPGQKDLERYKDLEEFVQFDLRKDISQEEILNSLVDKPKAIVAFSSTTLLTTKLFYGIPSYSFAKILLKKDINSYHKGRLRAFIQTFENQICFCNSVNEVVKKVIKMETL